MYIAEGFGQHLAMRASCYKHITAVLQPQYRTCLQATQHGDYVAIAEAWPGPQLPSISASMSPDVARSLGMPAEGSHLLIHSAADGVIATGS